GAVALVGARGPVSRGLRPTRVLGDAPASALDDQDAIANEALDLLERPVEATLVLAPCFPAAPEQRLLDGVGHDNVVDVGARSAGRAIADLPGQERYRLLGRQRLWIALDHHDGNDLLGGLERAMPDADDSQAATLATQHVQIRRRHRDRHP